MVHNLKSVVLTQLATVVAEKGAIVLMCWRKRHGAYTVNSTMNGVKLNLRFKVYLLTNTALLSVSVPTVPRWIFTSIVLRWEIEHHQPIGTFLLVSVVCAC